MGVRFTIPGVNSYKPPGSSGEEDPGYEWVRRSNTGREEFNREFGVWVGIKEH